MKIPATTGIYTCLEKENTVLLSIHGMGGTWCNEQLFCILFLWWNTWLPALMFSSKLAVALLMGSSTVFFVIQWNSLSYFPTFSNSQVTLLSGRQCRKKGIYQSW